MCFNTNTTKRNVGPLNLNVFFLLILSLSQCIPFLCYLFGSPTTYRFQLMLSFFMKNSTSAISNRSKWNWVSWRRRRRRRRVNGTSKKETRSNSKVRLHFRSRPCSMCLIIYYEVAAHQMNGHATIVAYGICARIWQYLFGWRVLAKSLPL